MTNQELLRIMQLADKKGINKHLLKKLLKRVEGKSYLEIKEILNHDIAKYSGVFDLYLDLPDINFDNAEILCNLYIYNNAFRYSVNTKTITLEQLDFLIKDVGNSMKNISSIPTYIGEALKINNPIELEFFHLVFNKRKELLAYPNKITYLLIERTIPLDKRIEIASLIEHEFQGLDKVLIGHCTEPFLLETINALLKYNYEFALSYLNINRNYMPIEVPNITAEEIELYIKIYDMLINMDNILEKQTNYKPENILKTKAIEFLTNSDISVEKREAFLQILKSKSILKGKALRVLKSKLSETNDIELTKLLSYMLANNDIRTKKYCFNFIRNETDIEVLRLAYQAFKINRVRKDTESLCILNSLQTKEEKIEFLNYLINKYPDKTAKEIEREQKLESQKDNLNYLLNEYLCNRLTFDKMEQALEESTSTTLCLTRTKKETKQKS